MELPPLREGLQLRAGLDGGREREAIGSEEGPDKEVGEEEERVVGVVVVDVALEEGVEGERVRVRVSGFGEVGEEGSCLVEGSEFGVGVEGEEERGDGEGELDGGSVELVELRRGSDQVEEGDVGAGRVGSEVRIRKSRWEGGRLWVVEHWEFSTVDNC